MAFADFTLLDGNYFKKADGSGPYVLDAAGVGSLIGAGGGGGGGASTIADGADVALGARADAGATTDTGTFSLVALAKRALQNWTTLLGRLPALVGGKVPVDVSFPATQAVSAAALPLPTGAATSAAQTAGNASLTSLDGKLPASLGSKTAAASLSMAPATDALFAANTLAAAGVARQLTAAVSGGLSANTALTTTCRRISITARLSDIRFAIGSTGQTASATTHFIAMGERLDLAVPATPNIAVLSATTTAGVLEVTELT